MSKIRKNYNAKTRRKKVLSREPSKTSFSFIQVFFKKYKVIDFCRKCGENQLLFGMLHANNLAIEKYQLFQNRKT